VLPVLRILPLIKSAIQQAQVSSQTFHIRHIWCPSNQTHAPTANLLNSEQLGSTPYQSPKLCSSVEMQRGTYTQMSPQYISFGYAKTLPPRLLLQQNPEWFILLVPAYPGCPAKKAVKRLCVCVYICQMQNVNIQSVSSPNDGVSRSVSDALSRH